MLSPVFADTYMYFSPNSLSFVYAAYAIFSSDSAFKSDLFPMLNFIIPMTMIRASSPLTYRTLSIHFPKLLNELASLFKLMFTCEVKYNDCCTAVLNVGRNE